MHNLNSRLLKLAYSFPMDYLGKISPTNENFGENYARHLQYLGAVDPESPEGAAYIQQHNIPFQAAKNYYNQGQSFNSYAQNYAPGLFQQLENQGMNTALLASMGPIQSMSHNLRLDLSPATQRQIYFGTSVGKKLGPVDTLGALFTGRAPAEDAAIQEAMSQMTSGAMKAYDRNSPLVRKLIASGGTGYLRSKIDEWAPRTTNMSQAINSFGNLALGMASMTPGYETAINWLADMKFGDKLNPNAPKATSTNTPAAAAAPNPNAPDSPNKPTDSQQISKTPDRV
jgi:hypothetical protein